jgi:hypothetical protein
MFVLVQVFVNFRTQLRDLGVGKVSHKETMFIKSIPRLSGLVNCSAQAEIHPSAL